VRGEGGPRGEWRRGRGGGVGTERGVRGEWGGEGAGGKKRKERKGGVGVRQGLRGKETDGGRRREKISRCNTKEGEVLSGGRLVLIGPGKSMVFSSEDL